MGKPMRPNNGTLALDSSDFADNAFWLDFSGQAADIGVHHQETPGIAALRPKKVGRRKKDVSPSGKRTYENRAVTATGSSWLSSLKIKTYEDTAGSTKSTNWWGTHRFSTGLSRLEESIDLDSSRYGAYTWSMMGCFGHMLV
jgi:hypothetical protein